MRVISLSLLGLLFLVGCKGKNANNGTGGPVVEEYPCRGTAKKVFETCGCSPVDNSLITLTDALDVDKNIKSSIHGCANGDLSLNAKDANLAKTKFEACITKDIVIPDDVRAMIIQQIDKATSESVSKSQQLETWNMCYAKTTGIAVAP